MATKMAVAFANLFMAETETKMLSESKIKPKVWKRYIDDVFSLWDVSRKDIDLFIEQANTFHPTIKYTAEISEKEITFLDVKTHFQPTETFSYTHYIPLATHQALREALLKEKQSVFSQQTPRKKIPGGHV